LEINVDFDTIDSSVTQITYFYEYKDRIYFATNEGGHIWESADGKVSTKNKAWETILDTNFVAVACFVELKD
jgi:hypothetical protein